MLVLEAVVYVHQSVSGYPHRRTGGLRAAERRAGPPRAVTRQGLQWIYFRHTVITGIVEKYTRLAVFRIGTVQKYTRLAVFTAESDIHTIIYAEIHYRSTSGTAVLFEY
eukprot:COSAG02_NODE_286_length_25649_cov_13.411272_6_plen_109_part_00